MKIFRMEYIPGRDPFPDEPEDTGRPGYWLVICEWEDEVGIRAGDMYVETLGETATEQEVYDAVMAQILAAIG
ncbi:hypothetical protein [Pannonibacter tanglangensis]|uniref:Uncharacterized protein n=1 Tax=Pannonibacter tanglangensis TaxID=2750084 RepID=A0ABW9ZDL6_9HYPH|nr:hypothetical protein [Pannonibacter sp. XCT-34]NBN62763.1 hypothetical protein [Pannonibacter sp. XCT-34]